MRLAKAMEYSQGYILWIGQAPTTPLLAEVKPTVKASPSQAATLPEAGLHDGLHDGLRDGLHDGFHDTDLQGAEAIARILRCPVSIATSPEQAVAQAQIEHPYLVILSGDVCPKWFLQVARQIRQSVQPERVVIVSLTDSSELSWMPTEASSDIDGFFVKPMSTDVLTALNESAIAKQIFLQPIAC